MTIDRETLMAYADGELDPLAAKRVERAVAADPALAAEVEAHRKLRAQLSGVFAPITDEPVPDRLSAMLAKRDNVVAFTPKPKPARKFDMRWAGAIAATLVVGVITGQMIRPASPIATGPAGLVASGELERALDSQLASNQQGAPIRMLASFRDTGGALCRTFSGRATSGIACRDGEGWGLRQTYSAAPGATTDYRQAGSGDAALMAAAQDMMAGAPLDAAQEQAARDKGWR